MSDGIWVDYGKLSLVNAQLKIIITELDEAGSRTDDLQDAIGNAYPYRRLSSRVGEFEGQWDDRRRDLIRDITKVQEHFQGVLDGLDEWDSQTAASFEVDATGADTAPRPI